MLANSLFFLASAALALASPVRNYGSGSSCSTGRPTPVLPVNGGPSELAGPPENATLKHIALGFGIQNYTCASAGADAAAGGALAVLYDITHLYPGTSRSSLSDADWAALTGTVLSGHAIPLNLNADGHGASATVPFPAEADLKIQGYKKFPFIGHHFFNAAGVPVFDLTRAKQRLNAKKISGIKAPTSASAGPDGTGAVDWLNLGDAGDSSGLNQVYRVFTAGGNSHGCTAQSTDSTSYTAMYWFYQ
ncbi:hypothetical protein FALBO_5184 [Fusarium albosuccineum]|uniref:Malate dehydrogenase n=1 Tax=Fusarium albosuccineum TaxID=1237068 RepID=A0A8H4LE22_9HYPO|nr:hypothetical protein FALBO_5184 [Fusarium albosuccineum]